MRLPLGLLVFRVLVRFKLLDVIASALRCTIKLWQSVVTRKVAFLAAVIAVCIFAGTARLLIIALVRRILPLRGVLARRLRGAARLALAAVIITLLAGRDLV